MFTTTVYLISSPAFWSRKIFKVAYIKKKTIWCNNMRDPCILHSKCQLERLCKLTPLKIFYARLEWSSVPGARIHGSLFTHAKASLVGAVILCTTCVSEPVLAGRKLNLLTDSVEKHCLLYGKMKSLSCGIRSAGYHSHHDNLIDAVTINMHCSLALVELLLMLTILGV